MQLLWLVISAVDQECAVDILNFRFTEFNVSHPISFNGLDRLTAMTTEIANPNPGFNRFAQTENRLTRLVVGKVVSVNLTWCGLFDLDFSKGRNWNNIEHSMDNATFPIKGRHRCNIQGPCFPL